MATDDWPDGVPRCTANSSRTGQRCRKQPMKGLAVCRTHGGSAPQVKAAAARKALAAELEATVATFGLPRDVSPAEALLEEVHRTAGHVAWLGLRVAELDAEALTWGVSSEVSKQATEFPGTDRTWSAATNALIDLYQRERKHLVDVCAAALKAGVEERRVQLEQAHAQMLVAALSWLLGQLGLRDDPAARALVGEMLQRMDRGEIAS